VRTRPKITAGSISTRINGERPEETRSNLKRTSIATCSFLHSIAAFLSYLRNPRNDLYHDSKIHLNSARRGYVVYKSIKPSIESSIVIDGAFCLRELIAAYPFSGGRFLKRVY